MDVIRTFIAISLSDPVRIRLQEISNDLQGKLKNRSLRWVSPQNIHLTIKFLGDMQSSAVAQLSQALSALGPEIHPFTMHFTEVGCFPNRHRPKVIWVGGQTPPELRQLFQAIDRLTNQLGFASENRPFSPHLTLARLAQHASFQDAAVVGEVVGAYQLIAIDPLIIAEFHLIKSDLRPQGPIYTHLTTITLQNQ
jgi:2'-5' RNA ligase